MYIPISKMCVVNQMNINTQAGRRIRGARLNHPTLNTLKLLSEASGISLKTISRIELGKVRPRFDTIVAICSALGVDLDYLADNKQAQLMRVMGKEGANSIRWGMYLVLPHSYKEHIEDMTETFFKMHMETFGPRDKRWVTDAVSVETLRKLHREFRNTY